jgi:glyoxylase-like metal-dependent hydrolase (beta-lactamase superfamily II)
MQPLAPGVSFFDLNFQGRPRVIAVGVLHGADGVALVDPGPASSLPSLRAALERAGIASADISAIALTHIHLDHAGGVGTLLDECPRARVYVHEAGARHLIDPSRLVASAARLYGDAMDRLWGVIRPVPADRLQALTGGETVDLGGRRWRVAYTPGHAVHHVSYFDPESGIVFAGDAAGVIVRPDGFVMPPTPPPDIDLALWRGSLATLAAWRAGTLVLTHFGPTVRVEAHLAELETNLTMVAELARQSLDQAGDDAGREAWFRDRMLRELRKQEREEDVRGYEAAGRFDLNWRGLARYWRKQQPADAPPAEGARR